ncbi:MAG: hypothetical protein ACKPBU_11740 [Alphaproteobacteria bacterium]
MTQGKASLRLVLTLVAVSILAGSALAAQSASSSPGDRGISHDQGPTRPVGTSRDGGPGSRLLLAQGAPTANERSNLNLSKSNVNRGVAPNPGRPGGIQPQAPEARADACENCRRWCKSRCVPPGPGEKDCVCIRSEPNID